MDKQKLEKLLKKSVDIQQGKEIALAKELISLDEKVDTKFSEADEKIESVKQDIESKIENIQKGEKGEDGDDGKDYILTDNDKKEIASKVEVPIVEKVIEKTETIIEKPIVTEITTNEIKEVAKYETSKEIVTKINKGDTLIKKDKIEGLSDIEYNLKHNLYTGISETRALELLRTTAPSVDLTGYVPYSGLSASNVTANTLTYFNASKQASSVTLGSGLSLSGGTLSNTGILAINSPTTNITVSGSDIDVNETYGFNWQNNHTWTGDISATFIPSSELGGGINLKNGGGNGRPFLRFSDSSGDFFVGFIAPDFNASNPQFYWQLPEQDAPGVWQSDGAGILSIAPVVLSTQVSGTLPVGNGGTGTATAFTTGSVIFAGASGVYTQDNTNLFFDNTNNRLGIGTPTPSYKLEVSGGDSITGYFTSSAGSTRLGVNNASNTGIGFYIGGTLRWSQAVVNGGGAGTNPDLVFYNDQTSTNALWIDGNNNNVSIGLVAPSTTNKLHVTSTYTTSASRIAYFLGTSGTSGIEVRTNGNAQYMARSSTHANTELRFQAFSDGNTYFGTATLSGTLNANLYIRTSADSGTNTGSIFMTLMGTQKVAVTSTGVGISNGALTPSSLLTLGAGTATAGTAPLRFTSGTLLTTPVAGAVEFLTDAFYATITTGAARKTFAFLEAPVFTTSIQTPTIELGHATDTTLTRVSAGIVAIEGTNILKNHTPPFIGNNSAAPNSAANVGSSNRAWYKAINVDNYVTVTGIRIGVAATSGNIDVGLYDSGGNKLASSGSVACPTANTKVTVAFTASVDIAPGTYYLAIVADNTTATFVRAGTDTIMGLGYEDTAFPLPSSASLSYMSIAGADRSFAILGVVSGGLSS